jgi:hypothetical protein
MRGVVYQHQLFQRPPDDPQVFHKELVGDEGTALAVEAVLDGTGGVNVVKDGVGVAFVACGKDDDVEVFAQFLEQLLGVRPDVHEPTAHLAL